MDQPSPYQTPASAPPPLQATYIAEPPALKVFGILHLIFSAFGLLMGGWSLLTLLIGNPMLHESTPGYEAQLIYQEKMKWVTALTGGFILIIAALLIVSGIKLVRSKPDGVIWSNRYAWFSIATKVISLFLSIFILGPATSELMQSTIQESGGNRGAGAAAIVRFTTSISMVIVPIISCVYPGLALFFLSRKTVKDWCEQSRRGGA